MHVIQFLISDRDDFTFAHLGTAPLAGAWALEPMAVGDAGALPPAAGSTTEPIGSIPPLGGAPSALEGSKALVGAVDVPDGSPAAYGEEEPPRPDDMSEGSEGPPILAPDGSEADPRGLEPIAEAPLDIDDSPLDEPLAIDP